jgi:CCR4-NOT transcription complex subunit 3
MHCCVTVKVGSCLCLQELKRQSWRYHKQHNAWFQRYAEPTVTNEEYEQV